MKNRWLYFLSLCLIGLSELPVHGIAFGNMANTVIEQWIMALTVAVGVPVAGHFARIVSINAIFQRSAKYGDC